jgi:hypothetical protein
VQGTSPSILQERDGLLNFISGTINFNAIYLDGKLPKTFLIFNNAEFPIDEMELYKRYPDLAIVPKDITISQPECTMLEKRTYVFCSSGTRFALYFPKP